MGMNAIWQREGPRRALITGASSGIGEAFARLLAEEGWDLVLVARNEEELHRVAGVVHAQHQATAHVLPADLSRPESIAALASRLQQRNLMPDVLINNAGFGLMGAATVLPREEQLRIIDVNVRAVIDLTLRLLPHMQRQQAGGVLNVASLAGLMPGPGMAAYHASKAALISFSEALAEEMRPHGVQVSALCPGPVKTRFQERAGMRSSLLVRLLPASRPARVARAGWQGFKEGRVVIMPGLFAAFTAISTRFVPRLLLRRINARLTGVHQHAARHAVNTAHLPPARQEPSAAEPASTKSRQERQAD